MKKIPFSDEEVELIETNINAVGKLVIDILNSDTENSSSITASVLACSVMTFAININDLSDIESIERTLKTFSEHLLFVFENYKDGGCRIEKIDNKERFLQ